MEKIRASKPIDFQLFDVSKDAAQQNDLAAKRPDVVARLRSMMEKLHSEVVEEGHAWDIPADYAAKNKRKIWNSE